MLGFLGNVAGGLLSTIGGLAESHRQRSYYTHMSETAHQREVEDLEKAGLNPMISAMGSGAASAMPTLQNPASALADVGSEIGRAQRSREAELGRIGVGNARKQGQVLDETAAKLRSDKALNLAMAINQEAQAASSRARAVADLATAKQIATRTVQDAVVAEFLDALGPADRRAFGYEKFSKDRTYISKLGGELTTALVGVGSDIGESARSLGQKAKDAWKSVRDWYNKPVQGKPAKQPTYQAPRYRDLKQKQRRLNHP